MHHMLTCLWLMTKWPRCLTGSWGPERLEECTLQFPRALHKCSKQTKTHNLALLRFSSRAPSKQEALVCTWGGGSDWWRYCLEQKLEIHRSEVVLVKLCCCRLWSYSTRALPSVGHDSLRTYCIPANVYWACRERGKMKIYTGVGECLLQFSTMG